MQQQFCHIYGRSPSEFGVRAKCDDPKPGRTSGPDFILETLQRFPNEVNILALGPLTNLALAWQQAPDVLALAKQIVIMGGTARHSGNCSPVAEFNFWVDPHAADLLLSSELPRRIPVTMVGLDVTHQVVFSPNLREIVRFFSHSSGPLAQLVYDLTRFYVDFHWQQERTIGCVINDPLIPAFLLRPNLLKGTSKNSNFALSGDLIAESFRHESLTIQQSILGFHFSRSAKSRSLSIESEFLEVPFS